MNVTMTECIRERRYRILLHWPFVWRWAWRRGTWEVVEVAHLCEDGTVLES